MVSPVPSSPRSTAVRLLPVRPSGEEGTVRVSNRLSSGLGETDERGPQAVAAPQNVGIRFQPRPDLDLIQARRIDRERDEVIREAPSSGRLRFQERFRDFLTEALGRHLDVRG